VPDSVKRKLTTILAADVEGYSRLMSTDEEATLKTLKSYREIIDGLIGKHDGRIFGTGGDSVIAEFGSTVEAVRCAITIQEELRIENAELAEEQQMKFRIGVNVGDVMVEGDNLYGDGVNIAARLEGEAEAGGICISGSAFEQVKNKLSISFEDIGPQQVKNIAEPVPAFRVVPGSVSVAATAATPSSTKRWRIPAIAAVLVVIIAVGGLAWWQSWFERDQPLTELDKPSIAVLPLDNLSGDPEQEIFVAGLTEDLNNALSRVPDLLVISSNSTSTYKGKTVDVKHVAKELGVRHVVQGSVQKSGDRLRVTMQLVDGNDGANIWSERYDRNVTDLFDLQDEIVKKVLVELQVKLTAGGTARIESRGTNNLEAWLLTVEASNEGFKFTPEANARARTLYQAASEADPNWAHPVGGLAWTYREAVRRGWSKSVEEDRRRGIALALKTIEMDPNEPLGYINLGNLYIESGRYEEGIALREKAVEIAPNHFFALAGLAWQLPFVGEVKRALDLYERAKTISPLHPAWLTASEAFALHVDGQHERAIEAFKQSIAGMNFPILHGRLAAVYADLGRMDEAREQIQILLTKKPDAKIQDLTRILKFQDTKRIDWYVNLLQAAGMPE
jgi:adenylate cyclase